MSDILTDARAWIDSQPPAIRTHSENCHLYHPECMAGRLVREVERRAKINEDYAGICKATERELATLKQQVSGLLAINESLRREVREQRKEIAALREERRAIIGDDRPWRNENPEGRWLT